MRLPSLESIKAERAKRDLKSFLPNTFPNYKMGWVHEEICAALNQFLQDIIDEKEPRLMITMPPRHGKSFIATERFPAWALGKYPHLEFIIASYGSDKAIEFSQRAREVFRSEYFKTVFPESKFGVSEKLNNWDVVGGGGYKAVGVGGALTGSGAHALIIDDPVKNWEEAVSKTYREKILNWYQSTAYTRLAPGAGVLMIQTRWHESDLAGEALKMEDEGWKVLNFPAVAENDEKYRKKGEALHSERYPIERLRKIEKGVGPRVWISLYQQKPRIDGGMHIKREWFNIIPKAPEGLQWRRFWDLAVKAKQQSDHSASFKGAMDREGNFYISTGLHFKREWPNTKKIILQMGKMEKIGVGIEAVSAFEIAVQEIRPALRGICQVKGYTVATDKLSRALPWIDLAENGKVFLVDGMWIPNFLDECEAFDPIKDASPDDQVDAVSGLFKMVNRTKKAGVM